MYYSEQQKAGARNGPGFSHSVHEATQLGKGEVCGGDGQVINTSDGGAICAGTVCDGDSSIVD